MSPSIEEIKEVLAIFLDSELQDLRLEIGNVRLAVAKGGGLSTQPFSSPAPNHPIAPPPAPATAAVTQAPAASPVAIAPAPAPVREGWVLVNSPSIGTFYRRPAPDQQPFVQIDSQVNANDPLCLIEVMKMFTGVSAPCTGRIAEILIADATVVEYGQPLMYIEPA